MLACTRVEGVRVGSECESARFVCDCDEFEIVSNVNKQQLKRTFAI